MFLNNSKVKREKTDMFSFLSNINNTRRSSNTSLVNKDGKISATKQGKDAGDCWLLSSVNALNSTKQGQEVLSNIFEYHNEGAQEEGYTLVHFATGDYKVDDIEVANVRNSRKYSSGDDDMIILELAAEKALNAAGDEVAFHSDTPYYIENIDLNAKNTNTVKDKGNFEKAMYMLTGKAASAYKEKAVIKDGEVTLNDNSIEHAINDYMQGNNDGKVMNVSIHKISNAELKDIKSGQNVKLESNHQYAVKNITQNAITLINPWDSSKEINLSLADFKNTFDQVEYIDLNEKNNERKYTSDEYTTDGKTKNFIFRNEDGTSTTKTYDNKDLKYEVLFDKDNNKISKKFYQNGKIAHEITYNSDNTKTIYRYDESGKNKTKKIDLDENGYMKGVWSYNSTTEDWETSQAQTSDVKVVQDIVNDEKKSAKEFYIIKSNGTFEHELSKLDKNGNKDTSSTVKLTNEEYKRMQESGLLENSQFSPKEIQSLLKANENDFKAAMNFIKSHQGVEYKFVQRYING